MRRTAKLSQQCQFFFWNGKKLIWYIIQSMVSVYSKSDFFVKSTKTDPKTKLFSPQFLWSEQHIVVQDILMWRKISTCKCDFRVLCHSEEFRF